MTQFGSVEILERVDPMLRLKQRVLVERIQSGIDREVEDVSFLEESRSFEGMFEFTDPVDEDVTILDESVWNSESLLNPLSLQARLNPPQLP